MCLLNKSLSVELYLVLRTTPLSDELTWRTHRLLVYGQHGLDISELQLLVSHRNTIAPSHTERNGGTESISEQRLFPSRQPSAESTQRTTASSCLSKTQVLSIQGWKLK